MLEAFKVWFSRPESWFNVVLPPLLMWALKLGFPWVRAIIVGQRERIKRVHQKRVGECARDDALTMKAVVSREVWLTIFILGSISWFAYVSLSPLRTLFTLGTPVFLLTLTPVWIFEILFLSRDSFTQEVLAERKLLRK